MRPYSRRLAAAALCVIGLTATIVAAPQPASAATPDGPSGPVIYHQGTWYLRSTPTTGTAEQSFSFGVPGSNLDLPVVGDWNGDGSETVGIARIDQSVPFPFRFVWSLRNTNAAGDPDITFTFGVPALTDTLRGRPIVGNFDPFDDAYEVGYVFPTDDGGLNWIIRRDLAQSSPVVTFQYGRSATDTPVVGDWNGDGIDTAGIIRGKQWMLNDEELQGGQADVSFTFGATSSPIRELPVVGDWDGNGTDTPAVLRNNPTTQVTGGFEVWLYRNENAAGPADGGFVFGSDVFAIPRTALFVPRLAIEVS
ncbi:hypothetical protein [Cryptosporangium aurantiacum]|uniref:Uncharacterized protein n=1 Tax=Cryptosporangium aurantiacum TaxID=134849 RepID=A0A1M7RI37_9ACTN|nr:hypothetical protein [Cryptosporangium aurantiacum]SHN45965.1 hypothetical protein SAMN05443668_113108 [Cryptosporangium aurantiacum]